MEGDTVYTRETSAASEADPLYRTNEADVASGAVAAFGTTITAGANAPLGAGQPVGASSADAARADDADFDASNARDDDGPLPTDVQPAVEPQTEPSLEERCEAIERLVLKQPEHREIYEAVLGFCRQRRSQADVEAYIQSLPECVHESQSPYFLIKSLVRAGGLARVELDAEGEVVTPERKAGLDEDALDDLVCDVAYETTEAGCLAHEDLRPVRRFEHLLERQPTRRNVYCEVLGFCSEPRTRHEIEDLLRGRQILIDEAVDGQPLKPSVFIDKLERSGVLVWKGGWVTSEDGMAYLEAHAC